MAQEMKTVLFRNFSDQVFSSTKPHEVTVGDRKAMIVDENCKWGGEDYSFEPGETRYMPDWKAAHFAKHLANRELLRLGFDNDTSPKRPKDNPRYMEMFNKAYIEDPKSMPMSESMAEDDLLSKNKDLEIERLKAELEAAKKGTVNPPEAPHIGLEKDPTEGMVPHKITEEDIKNNPGIEKDVKVGDEVLLPAETDEDETEDGDFEGLEDGAGNEEDKKPE